jgi:hypothetical protein
VRSVSELCPEYGQQIQFTSKVEDGEVITVGKSGNPAKRADQVKPVNSTANDQIMVVWCDNGTVDGKFMEGVVYTMLTSGLPITSAQRVQGNQIGRQRQTAFDVWHRQTNFDWLLWVDSDIVLTNESLQKVWNSRHIQDRPVVSGTYFISKQMESSIMQPYPAVFMAHEDDKYLMTYVHPLPPDALMKVDYAGFGFLLMHRSVADKMREFHGDISFFIESMDEANREKDTFIGEDIQFFMKMKEAGIPLHVHTGATVKHMKRFAFDEEFYKLYWITMANSQAAQARKEKEAEAQAPAPDTSSSN